MDTVFSSLDSKPCGSMTFTCVANGPESASWVPTSFDVNGCQCSFELVGGQPENVCSECTNHSHLDRTCTMNAVCP
jgi:hypothetical protein